MNEALPWQNLGLSPSTLELIEKAGYTTPTPVQSATLPLAMKGNDLIVSAETGTGKTAGFVLPMVEKFAKREGTYGLILAPTREIAQQIHATIEIFGKPVGVRSIVLIGGTNMRVDARALDTYPQIIVATPGRLCDHLERGNLWLDFIEILVLDEADRMLDMGFSTQLGMITNSLSGNQQTLLFSATITPVVENLARKILKNPQRVTIGKPISTAKRVEQNFIWVNRRYKDWELKKLLQTIQGSVMVFTRSKIETTRLWRTLHSAGFHDATYISSDRQQSHRQEALEMFKSGKVRILIATDMAGRGLHIDNVEHVINYDLPMEPEDYVHRIGRTGRADASGKATSFVTDEERKYLFQIEKLLGTKIQPKNAETFDARENSAPSRFNSRDSKNSKRPSGRSNHKRR